METTKRKGFTLIELLIVLAILLVLIGISVLTYSNIQTASNESICRSQRQEAINLYRIYIASGGDYDVDGSTGMGFLVDNLLLNEEYKCPLGGVYTWHIDDDYNVSINCSKHGELYELYTPLGNNFNEITTSLKIMVEKYFEENGCYPRSWGEFAYTDLGLKSEDWDKPYEHVIYRPRGSSFSISPQEGYKMVVTGADKTDKVIKERYNWNLWYDFISKEWYYKSITEENLIDIETLRVLVD